MMLVGMFLQTREGYLQFLPNGLVPSRFPAGGVFSGRSSPVDGVIRERVCSAGSDFSLTVLRMRLLRITGSPVHPTGESGSPDLRTTSPCVFVDRITTCLILSHPGSFNSIPAAGCPHCGSVSGRRQQQHAGILTADFGQSRLRRLRLRPVADPLN